MFMVIIRYSKPLAEVDVHRQAHLEFIEKNIQADTILVAGRQIPADGGAFLARASSRAEIEAMVALDPYNTAGVADFEIIEFTAAKTHPSCQHLQAA